PANSRLGNLRSDAVRKFEKDLNDLRARELDDATLLQQVQSALDDIDAADGPGALRLPAALQKSVEAYLEKNPDLSPPGFMGHAWSLKKALGKGTPERLELWRSLKERLTREQEDFRREAIKVSSVEAALVPPRIYHGI